MCQITNQNREFGFPSQKKQQNIDSNMQCLPWIFQNLTSECKILLVRRDSLPFLDFGLYILDGIWSLHNHNYVLLVSCPFVQFDSNVNFSIFRVWFKLIRGFRGVLRNKNTLFSLIDKIWWYLHLGLAWKSAEDCVNQWKIIVELSCCKKRPPKRRNWFGEYGTSKGSEWYQIDH